MRRSYLGFAMAAAVALAVGCVGSSKGLSAEDKERLKGYVLDAPPADIQKLDVNFENKAHLIGYKFEPPSAKPGDDVKLTYYWRADDTIDPGWMLFTHTKDEGNGRLGNLDNDGPIRENRNGDQILGPGHWDRGKIYVDEQTYKIPTDVNGAEVTILVGIWKADARLRVLSGPNDGENCAIVGRIKTGVVPKPEEHTEVPSLTVTRLADNAKITIDGKAHEPQWEGAASTGPFVDVGSGKPAPTSPVNGAAKLLWDDRNLYVLFNVKDDDAYVGFTDAKSQPDDFTAAGQPKLWSKDTVEMMVDPDPSGDNRDYYELQINPQNKIFKSQFDTLQQPNGGPNGPFGHEDWDPKLKSAVQLEKGADGKVTGYTVEVAIPWAAYAKAANHPPKPGDVWRVNFYAMKNNGGVSWSPIRGQGNFHFAPRFGRIMWAIPGPPAESSASVAAAPAPPGGAPPAAPAGAGPAAVTALQGDGGRVRLLRRPPPLRPADSAPSP